MFKVGDRVRIVDSKGFFSSRIGLTGTIIDEELMDPNWRVVKFDDPNVSSDCGPVGDLKLLNSDEQSNTINKLIKTTMSFIKKLLNPDDALVEKHFTTDGQLNLIDPEVQAAIYKVIKGDLVEAAKEKEAEASK